MIIDHLDDARKTGYHEGFHEGIEAVIKLIYKQVTDPSGVSAGTKSVLSAIVSASRILEMNNAFEKDKLIDNQ